MEYEPVIGLEVHVQLATRSKIFCSCSTEFGQPPNNLTCPVCLGLPGSLPVLNKLALEYAIKTALALNCKIADFIKFDRKNYFYPDLPKNFQISQYDKPLSYDGYLDIILDRRTKRIGINRVHLEEDAGKLLHENIEDGSLIDYNRSGIPLLEIVSLPDIKSPDEAYEYLLNLKAILRYLEVSDCDMEKGSLRCDANISLRPVGSKGLGVKIELKNMNSFKGIRSALEFEIRRQEEILKTGGELFQETRLWDEEIGETTSMRTKEEAHDYRYFPEPDLAPFIIEENQIREIAFVLPELPKQRRERFIKDYGIPNYDASVLTSDKPLADYFEECIKLLNRPKIVSNWIMTELLGQLNSRKIKIEDLKLKPSDLIGMLKMIEQGTISGKIAKEIFAEMIATAKSAATIVKEKSLQQLSDREQLENIIGKVFNENSKSVEDYLKGKENAFMFLVGQVMKETKGKANPHLVNEILKKKLKGENDA